MIAWPKTVTLHASNFSHCVAMATGGALAADMSESSVEAPPEFTSCIFEFNRLFSPIASRLCQWGGALHLRFIGGFTNRMWFQFSGCSFCHNSIHSSSRIGEGGSKLYGGAVSLYGWIQGTFTRCIFTNNGIRGWFVAYGGAIMVRAQFLNMAVTDSNFTSNWLEHVRPTNPPNSSVSGGAALHVSHEVSEPKHNSTLRVRRCRFNWNTHRGFWTSLGGGVRMEVNGAHSYILFSDCLFAGSLLQSFRNASGGAIYYQCVGASTRLLQYLRCSFEGNSAQPGNKVDDDLPKAAGGAVTHVISQMSDATRMQSIFTSCSFKDNRIIGGSRSSLVGGALCFSIACDGCKKYAPDVSVHRCDFTNNSIQTSLSPSSSFGGLFTFRVCAVLNLALSFEAPHSTATLPHMEGR